MAKKVVRNLKSSSKGRHWGITVLSVLGYIGSVFTLLAGLFMLFGGSFIASMVTKYAAMPDGSLVGMGLVAAGILFIACAVLDFFVARGMWKGQNWARILVLILLALSALSALFSLSLVDLIIDAILIWYLGFYKPAVSWFK